MNQKGLGRENGRCGREDYLEPKSVVRRIGRTWANWMR